MIVFYLFYLFLAPVFLNRKKLTEFFLFSFLAVLILPFFGYTILFVSRAYFDGTFHNFYHGYSIKVHMSGFYPVLTAAVFGSFFSVIINWFTTMNQKAELDKQKMTAELDLLKSKLNPHFLFNSLNNIDSLIHSNPEKASVALIRLSEIMRYMTYETSSEYVPLRKEIDYINNVIELHRLRIKAPAEINFEVKGNLEEKISPALFVPLLENAFKYAVYNENDPFVDIHVYSKEGIIQFNISNFYKKSMHDAANSGYGLINLKKRLDLIYPGKYELITDDNKKRYDVKLTIFRNAD
jgi:LytS/YehU family sensor histidine kinase